LTTWKTTGSLADSQRLHSAAVDRVLAHTLTVLTVAAATARILARLAFV